MSHPRARFGAELVAIGLVLAALVGAFGLIMAAYRRPGRAEARLTPPVPVAVVAAPPIPVPPPPPEPEPTPPAPAPAPETIVREDPTPGVIAPLRAAEAEQREAAARIDREIAALDTARRAAEADADRWSRRESVARGQLAAIGQKARNLEAEAAALAADHDVLAQRRDSARVAADKARNRPSSAILPHRGPNGTWRRPIAIECRDGQAVLQPRGRAFDLLDLAAEGGRPASHPFVAAVLREVVRIQGESGPDGNPVVPYIFFVVRPNGIRPYYEARGRLEPLGITFGYELIEQELAIDFPDLDDTATWDGSAPSRKAATPLARNGRTTPGTGSPGRTEAAAGSPGRKRPGSADDFVWTMPRFGRLSGIDTTTPARNRADEPGTLEPPSLALADPGQSPHTGGDATGDGLTPSPREVGPATGGNGGTPTEGGHLAPPSGRGTAGIEPGSANPPGVGTAGRPLLGEPGTETGTSDRGPGMPPTQTGAEPGGSTNDHPAPPSALRPERGTEFHDPNDPANTFVWPAGRGGDGAKPSESTAPGSLPEGETEAEAEAAASGVPRLPTPREVAAARRAGGRVVLPPSGKPSQGENSSGGPGTDAAGSTPANPAGSDGGSGAPGSTPPPPGAQVGGAGSRSLTDRPSHGTIIERPFELVVTCGPRGATIHPGGYRVTTQALEARDGLLIQQMDGMVAEQAKNESYHGRPDPRVRFVVQPGGEATYRSAKAQVVFSGRNWPTSFQVVGPDPIALLPSESW